MTNLLQIFVIMKYLSFFFTYHNAENTYEIAFRFMSFSNVTPFFYQGLIVFMEKIMKFLVVR